MRLFNVVQRIFNHPPTYLTYLSLKNKNKSNLNQIPHSSIFLKFSIPLQNLKFKILTTFKIFSFYNLFTREDSKPQLLLNSNYSFYMSLYLAVKVVIIF